jgi:hypothetical protein
LLTYVTQAPSRERRFTGRWIDATGKPVTDWFDAGPVTSQGEQLRALIGGGAALNDSTAWRVIPSGKPQVQPPPAFLPSGATDFTIVMGGRAYAVTPIGGPQGTRPSTLVAPTGETCGQLPSVGDPFAYVEVGRDGTLIGLGGANHCTASYYPQLLK